MEQETIKGYVKEIIKHMDSGRFIDAYRQLVFVKNNINSSQPDVPSTLCEVCGKTKEKHIKGRWCYKTINGPASSADWKEFRPKGVEDTKSELSFHGFPDSHPNAEDTKYECKKHGDKCNSYVKGIVKDANAGKDVSEFEHLIKKKDVPDTKEELDKEVQHWLLENSYSNLEITDKKDKDEWKYISDLIVEFYNSKFPEDRESVPLKILDEYGDNWEVAEENGNVSGEFEYKQFKETCLFRHLRNALQDGGEQ